MRGPASEDLGSPTVDEMLDRMKAPWLSCTEAAASVGPRASGKLRKEGARKSGAPGYLSTDATGERPTSKVFSPARETAEGTAERTGTR